MLHKIRQFAQPCRGLWAIAHRLGLSRTRQPREPVAPVAFGPPRATPRRGSAELLVAGHEPLDHGLAEPGAGARPGEASGEIRPPERSAWMTQRRHLHCQARGNPTI